MNFVCLLLMSLFYLLSNVRRYKYYTYRYVFCLSSIAYNQNNIIFTFSFRKQEKCSYFLEQKLLREKKPKNYSANILSSFVVLFVLPTTEAKNTKNEFLFFIYLFTYALIIGSICINSVFFGLLLFACFVPSNSDKTTTNWREDALIDFFFIVVVVVVAIFHFSIHYAAVYVNM